MESRRAYSMANRSQGVEENRAAVRAAVTSMAAEVRLADISLAGVAERSGVSVRTLLRYYGSRDDLIRTVAEEMQGTVIDERPVYPDDIDRSLDLLGTHYESVGPLVLMLLAQETTDPMARAITTQGKGFHRDWVAALFGLDVDAAGDAELLDLLVVSTDLSTWKLLRFDRALSHTDAVDRMRQMARAVRSHLAANGDHGTSREYQS